MSEKLIVFDIDGTIVSYKNGIYIPKETTKAIEKLQSNGHIITFASARSYLTALPLMKELNISSAVLHNGAQIILNNQCIYSRKIGRITSQIICKKLLETPLCIFAFDGENIYTHNATKDSIDYIKKQTGKPNVIKPLCNNKNSLFSVNLYGDYDIDFSDIKSVVYNKNIYEITAKHVNKKNGIKKLAKALNFKKSDIIAVGDGINDIEMLKYAGTGIAVGNACEKLKLAADTVCDDIENGGILKVFTELRLI